MKRLTSSKQLREWIRIFERQLGTLEDCQADGCASLAQCHALVEIGRAKNISLNELARLLDIENSTMSRTINTLVNRGLVEREINPQDRRYVNISLSDSGVKLFENIESSMSQFYERIFDRIPENKRECVLESLGILIKAMNTSKQSTEF